MLGKDMNQRWYDIVPETQEGHRPGWANLPRSTFGDRLTGNLAGKARATVDSYYSTRNVDDWCEVYPPLNQVAVEWAPRKNNSIVDLKWTTVTPNFSRFTWRFDAGMWKEGIQNTAVWLLHPGENRFEICSINSVGRKGRKSEIVLTKHADSGQLDIALMENGVAYETVHSFNWEDFQHSTLGKVREKYHLDDVIADAKTDLERVCLLRDWVKSRWNHDQPIVCPPWDVSYLLDHTDKHIESFYCLHYSIAFMQCCASLGIPARLINLHRGINTTPFEGRGYGKEYDPENPNDEHVVNEVWLNDLGKWAMMDVDFDIHYETNQIPLNAVEIHNLVIDKKFEAMTVMEGPYAWKLKSSPDWYSHKLPVYYTHVCVFWRNNHLSDPSGPTQILHWVDDRTPWMLWWEGEDLHHRPSIIGPMVISWPYSNSTPVITDGNMVSTWASSDEPVEHWVELAWDEPLELNRIEILWAKYWESYFNSRSFVLQAWLNGSWETIACISTDQEKAIDVLKTSKIKTGRIRLWQGQGGGSEKYPNRLWIAEIGVFNDAE